MMERGIKTRDGLRSRHTTDVEEGLKYKYDDDETVSIEDHGRGDRDGRPSRFCEIVTRCIPNVPMRQTMIRCEQRCCSARKGSFSVIRQRILRLSGAGCCHIFYNLLRARATGSSEIPVGNRIGPTSMKTPDTDTDTDEETLDDCCWPTGSSAAVPVPVPVPVLVPQSPKLTDFSKSRARLPEYGPTQIEFCAEESSDIDIDIDIDDNESITEEDLLRSSQGKPSGEKVIFSLRLPKKKRKEKVRDPPVRTFSNTSRNSLQAMVQSRRSNSRENLGDKRSKIGLAQEMLDTSTQSKPKALPNHRRRRGSGDTAENTARNVFIAPFPRPLSRENSIDRLNDDLRSPKHTPSQRSKTLKNKEFRALLNSPSGRSESGLLRDFTMETTMELNDMSDPDASRGLNSDDEVDPDLKARRILRMGRRNSFVKGSKIERFDGNDSQSRARRALQRREAVKNAESYTEWKLELMANG
jgi:hypothetical protein